MKILSKALVFFLFLLSTFYFLSSATHTYAASQTIPTQSAQYPSPNTTPDVPNNLHNWTQNVMIEVMNALTCQLAGVDPTNPKQSCLGIDQKSGKIGFVPSASSGQGNGGGAIGVMGNMISMLYTPPLHTSDYFQNLAQNFGITKKTYAQTTGTGFQGLTPLINIWSAFRNIVYLLLVIVFIVIGLAIMLRIKIDPRTVMSIQNQIPKIIIGILVVTFSFAIAGFLIDLMWVFIYLIYGMFSGIPDVNLGNLNPANIQGQAALRVAGHISDLGIFGIANDVAGSVKGVFQSLLGITGCPLNDPLRCVNNLFNPLNFVLDPNDNNVVNILFNLISTVTGGAMFFKILGIGAPNLAEGIPGFSALFQLAAESTKLGIATTAGAGVYASTQLLLREFLPYLIVYLIIFIALLVALFRLWFTLIIAYVHILIDVVLAPFWIIGGIVPGSPISLTGWLRDIIANLAAFPAVIGMFMLGKVFMDAFGTTQNQGQFVPPLIGNPGSTDAIGSLIGLGIILMTPNVVNMLKTALKAPKLDTGLGKAIGVGVGLPINVGKNIGGSLIGSQEAVMRKGPTGQYDWGERGIPRTIFGRFFGR